MWKNVLLQAWRMPSPAWVFCISGRCFLSLCVFLRFSNLFSAFLLLWSFCEGACQGGYRGSPQHGLVVGGLVPLASARGMRIPLFLWYFPILFTVLPCVSLSLFFKACVCCSLPGGCFPFGGQKGGIGVQQGGRQCRLRGSGMHGVRWDGARALSTYIECQNSKLSLQNTSHKLKTVIQQKGFSVPSLLGECRGAYSFLPAHR